MATAWTETSGLGPRSPPARWRSDDKICENADDNVVMTGPEAGVQDQPQAREAREGAAGG